MKKLLLAITILVTSIFSVNAADYKVDYEGAHASIQFKIKHLGFSWLTGRFNKFDGEFSYDSSKIENSKISMTIDVASVSSNLEARDQFLRGNYFLNADTHPNANFISTDIVDQGDGKFDVIGYLTLNGVTKQIVINAELVGEGKDPWGGYRAGFTGKTTFALKDFNMNKMDLDKASSHVTMALNIEGIKK